MVIRLSGRRCVGGRANWADAPSYPTPPTALPSFPSLARAKVVRDKSTHKTKAYGFVSFLDAVDGARALKEMDGAYIGARPCKLRRSTWAERTPGGVGGGGGGKGVRLPSKRTLKKHCIVPQPQ